LAERQSISALEHLPPFTHPLGFCFYQQSAGLDDARDLLAPCSFDPGLVARRGLITSSIGRLVVAHGILAAVVPQKGYKR
jgi:hypothetical protein